MAVTAQSVLQRVIDVLQDPTFKRWTAAELVRWFNEGQRAIVAIQPESTAEEEELTLVAGSHQSIGDGQGKLLDVRRNVGGPSISLADRMLMNAVKPNWQATTAARYVQHFMYDARDPRAFDVYPPAMQAGASKVIALVSMEPTDIAEPAGNTLADVAGDASVPDRLITALIDYVLYRAFSKDAVHANAQRAMAHFASFGNALGLDTAGTAKAGPIAASPYIKPAKV